MLEMDLLLRYIKATNIKLRYLGLPGVGEALKRIVSLPLGLLLQLGR